jgi:hypothetical protein
VTTTSGATNSFVSLCHLVPYLVPGGLYRFNGFPFWNVWPDSYDDGNVLVLREDDIFMFLDLGPDRQGGTYIYFHLRFGLKVIVSGTFRPTLIQEPE